MKDFVAIAEQYAHDVMSARIPACRYVRLACGRHLDDLKDADSSYYLDAAAANRACGFVELLPHVKGKWAREKLSIQLSPWQAFGYVNVFGWKRKADALRRYRRVYIEVPRKNGKSTWTAGAGLYMQCADGEHGAEVYSGATTEKQAWEVFGPARLMARGLPDLQEAYGLTVGAKNLHILETASKFEPVIGKPGDGASPSMSITDEYHEHDTADQYDTMLTGMGAREQPIAWVITTAGVDTSGPCYALRQEAIEALDGKIQDDELFALIYTVDEEKKDRSGNVIQEGDKWSDPAALRKANPNIGVSVFEDFLFTKQQRAINNPREQATFKTKHLNVWVGAASPYFNLERWLALDDAPPINEIRSELCFIGLDLAAKLDIAANVKLFYRYIGGVRHYYVYGRYYIPEERSLDPERRHYLGWVKSGQLIATPGNITDYDYIEADIKDDADAHPVERIAADPHNATMLLTHLQGWFGVDTVIEVPQTVLYLSEPMKEVQALIVDGRIHHDGNPALSWMIGNVTAQEDRNQNVFPRKEKPENKIDGAVALIIALGCAMRHDPADMDLVVI